MIHCVRLLALALLALALPLAADDKPKPESGKNVGFEKMKKLVGEWVVADDKGKPTDKVITKFRMTAAGSAIEETIFPGEGHEMVSVYHLDKGDLVMTHYCALGNQPKMKLDPKSGEKELKFVFVGGTNLDPDKDMHMHEGSIIIVDDDHIESTWQGYDKGKPAEGHKASYKLVRKK